MVPAKAPKVQPQKQAEPSEVSTVNDGENVWLKAFTASLEKAVSLDQVKKLQDWLRQPKQANFLAAEQAIEAQALKLIHDRILALGAVKTAVPEEEGKAIDANEDEYPEFDLEDAE